MYRWPCVKPKAPSKIFGGHGAKVASVRFTPSGNVLASIGESDRCLFQWTRLSNGDGSASSCPDNVRAFLEKGVSPPVLEPTPNEFDTAWKDDAAAPTDAGESSEILPPSAAPSLDFCYGVPSQKARVAYNKRGDVVFAGGRLGVVYHKAAHAQSFFEAANAPLSAFAASGDGAYAAVAEVGSVAKVHVFDATTARPVAVLTPRLRSATTLAFSADGSTLAALGKGPGGLPTLATWVSPTGAWVDASPGAVRALPFSVLAFAAFGGPKDLAIGGVGDEGSPDLVFYAVSGRNVAAYASSKPEGGFAGYACGAAVGSALLAGAPSGALEKWVSSEDGGTVRELVDEHAHAGGVTAVAAASDGRGASGGADGWVKVRALETFEVLASFFVGSENMTTSSSAQP